KPDLNGTASVRDAAARSVLPAEGAAIASVTTPVPAPAEVGTRVAVRSGATRHTPTKARRRPQSSSIAGTNSSSSSNDIAQPLARALHDALQCVLTTSGFHR